MPPVVLELETPIARNGVKNIDITALPQHVDETLKGMQRVYQDVQIEKAIRHNGQVTVYFCGKGRNPLNSYTYFEK